MKRKVQAQRKFAQGAYIPPSASSSLERRPDAPAVREEAKNHYFFNMSASGLLDYVASQGTHKHNDPNKGHAVVVLERLQCIQDMKMTTPAKVGLGARQRPPDEPRRYPRASMAAPAVTNGRMSRPPDEPRRYPRASMAAPAVTNGRARRGRPCKKVKMPPKVPPKRRGPSPNESYSEDERPLCQIARTQRDASPKNLRKRRTIIEQPTPSASAAPQIPAPPAPAPPTPAPKAPAPKAPAPKAPAPLAPALPAPAPPAPAPPAPAPPAPALQAPAPPAPAPPAPAPPAPAPQVPAPQIPAPQSEPPQTSPTKVKAKKAKEPVRRSRSPRPRGVAKPQKSDIMLRTIRTAMSRYSPETPRPRRRYAIRAIPRPPKFYAESSISGISAASVVKPKPKVPIYTPRGKRPSDAQASCRTDLHSPRPNNHEDFAVPSTSRGLKGNELQNGTAHKATVKKPKFAALKPGIRSSTKRPPTRYKTLVLPKKPTLTLGDDASIVTETVDADLSSEASFGAEFTSPDLIARCNPPRRSMVEGWLRNFNPNAAKYEEQDCNRFKVPRVPTRKISRQGLPTVRVVRENFDVPDDFSVCSEELRSEVCATSVCHKVEQVLNLIELGETDDDSEPSQRPVSNSIFSKNRLKAQCSSKYFKTVRSIVHAKSEFLNQRCGHCKYCSRVEKVMCLSRMVQQSKRRKEQLHKRDVYEFNTDTDDENPKLLDYRRMRKPHSDSLNTSTQAVVNHTAVETSQSTELTSPVQADQSLSTPFTATVTTDAQNADPKTVPQILPSTSKSPGYLQLPVGSTILRPQVSDTPHGPYQSPTIILLPKPLAVQQKQAECQVHMQSPQGNSEQNESTNGAASSNKLIITSNIQLVSPTKVDANLEITSLQIASTSSSLVANPPLADGSNLAPIASPPVQIANSDSGTQVSALAISTSDSVPTPSTSHSAPTSSTSDSAPKGLSPTVRKPIEIQPVYIDVLPTGSKLIIEITRHPFQPNNSQKQIVRARLIPRSEASSGIKVILVKHENLLYELLTNIATLGINMKTLGDAPAAVEAPRASDDEDMQPLRFEEESEGDVANQSKKITITPHQDETTAEADKNPIVVTDHNGQPGCSTTPSTRNKNKGVLGKVLSKKSRQNTIQPGGSTTKDVGDDNLISGRSVTKLVITPASHMGDPARRSDLAEADEITIMFTGKDDNVPSISFEDLEKIREIEKRLDEGAGSPVEMKRATRSFSQNSKKKPQAGRIPEFEDSQEDWSCSNANKVPNNITAEDLAKCFTEAPVYYPTEEEFTQDPLEYFEKISEEASKYGLCKVVAPASFKPKCNITDEVRFTVVNQYTSQLYRRWGAASRDMCAIKAYLAEQKVFFSRPPLFEGIELNLPKLYRTVQRYGGLKKVIEKKRWGRVAEEMRFPRSRRASRRLDEIYVKHLLPYDTLSDAERAALMEKVEKSWERNYQRMLGRASNPLHRQKLLLGESDESSDDADTDDDANLAVAIAEAEDCFASGRSMELSVFKKAAETALCTMLEQTEQTSPGVVELEYWKLVSTAAEHVCVNSASIDTGDGYGFATNHSDPHSTHPWNLKMMSQNKNNVLRSLGSVLGVTAPTLHLNMVFSTSCWHRDPHGLPWIEYMHDGPGKIWYGIPDHLSEEFRSAVESLCPTSCQNKSIWLPSDITMIPPTLLASHRVPLARLVQNPGEFVIVFPKAYSSSISTGYTVSESVYFAPSAWLDDVADVFQELRDSCEPTMFSLERLLISVAVDESSPPEVARRAWPALRRELNREIAARTQLRRLGLEPTTMQQTSGQAKKRPAGAWNVREQDECDICRATLYLTKVTGLARDRSAYCPEHAQNLLQKKIALIEHHRGGPLGLGDIKQVLESVVMTVFTTDAELLEIERSLSKRLGYDDDDDLEV